MSELDGEKRRIVDTLSGGGICPTTTTGLALLDLAVTVLVLNDHPVELIRERVTERLAQAADLAVLMLPTSRSH
jgi:hypothetical protein